MPPGQLLAQRLPALPPLAWIARVTGRSVRLFCGDAVDIDERARRWFEGAWAGTMDSDPFRSYACFASGGYVTDDAVLIFGPSHTSERLWLTQPPQSSGVTHVSNSLPLLLADARLGLDWRYRRYVYDLHTIMQGPGAAKQTIPARAEDGSRVLIHTSIAHGWRIGADGRVDPVPFASPPEFQNFEHYRGVLAEAMTATARHAADPSRRRPMSLVATLSGGYDSPATAVLAREAGCRDAVLFVEGRDSDYTSLPDDGRRIAQRLGLTPHVYHRLDYLRRDDMPEAWCLALGEFQDVPFAAMQEQLAGRLVVTGHRGGTVWDTADNGAPPLANVDYSGCTLTELRLRFGFVAVHLAFVGSAQRPRLVELSRSDAMAPWRVGGGYDRPIARRIVEEAGVARGEFGTKKAAVSQGYRTLIGDLQQAMTSRGWNDLLAFAASQPRFGLISRWRWKLADDLDKRRLRALRRRVDRGEPVPFNALNALLSRPWRYTRCSAETALHWANDRLRREYARALTGTRALYPDPPPNPTRVHTTPP